MKGEGKGKKGERAMAPGDPDRGQTVDASSFQSTPPLFTEGGGDSPAPVRVKKMKKEKEKGKKGGG